MELAVLWVVLIAIGAFVLGLIGGWSTARRARAAVATASPSLAKPAGAPSAATTASESVAAPAMSDTATSRTAAVSAATDETASSDPEVSGHRIAGGDAPGDDGAAGDATVAPAVGAMAATARLERDERARYAEIIGIETENASLRAVAARVPGLERRIRELEAAIEEHGGHGDQVIDLTGAALPVVGPDSADVTPR